MSDILLFFWRLFYSNVRSVIFFFYHFVLLRCTYNYVFVLICSLFNFLFLFYLLKFCNLTNCSHVCLQTILLGDSGVGKTSLLVQFDTGRFQPGNFAATVGIGFTVSNTTLRYLIKLSSLTASCDSEVCGYYFTKLNSAKRPIFDFHLHFCLFMRIDLIVIRHDHWFAIFKIVLKINI